VKRGAWNERRPAGDPASRRRREGDAFFDKLRERVGKKCASWVQGAQLGLPEGEDEPHLPRSDARGLERDVVLSTRFLVQSGATSPAVTLPARHLMRTVPNQHFQESQGRRVDRGAWSSTVSEMKTVVPTRRGFEQPLRLGIKIRMHRCGSLVTDCFSAWACRGGWPTPGVRRCPSSACRAVLFCTDPAVCVGFSPDAHGLGAGTTRFFH